ncbi:chemotaxis protein CheW, partial [Pseudomonas sp. CrR25]|nr:chemotaxis protein CheW [Pseudomonas sp. CrR25]
MSRPVAIATRPQLALQSYLDSLLQDAAVELAESVGLDEFEAAVLEEQVRDARLAPVAPL